MYSQRCRGTATSLRIQLELSETYFVVYFQTFTHFYAHNLLAHILLYLTQKYSIYGGLMAILYKCILRDVGKTQGSLLTSLRIHIPITLKFFTFFY